MAIIATKARRGGTAHVREVDNKPKRVCRTCNKRLHAVADYYEGRLECKSCYTKRVRFNSSLEFVENLPERLLEAGSYIVTSVLPNTRVDGDSLRALKSLACATGMQIICLGLKPHQKPLKDEVVYYPTSVPAIERALVTAKGDRIADFRVNPQALNPLTGMDRIGGGNNIIVASPKLALKMLPAGTSGSRFLASTGSISVPNYRTTERVGIIAEGLHTQGGLVVVVGESGSIVSVSPLEIAKGGTLLYKGNLYGRMPSNSEVAKQRCLVLGDLHLPPPQHAEGDSLLAVTCYLKQLVRKCSPDTLVLHDVLSFESVSHHNTQKPFTRPYHTVATEIDTFVELFGKIITHNNENLQRLVLVPSNHDSHLWKYIQEGRFMRDSQNIDVCLDVLNFRNYPNPVLSYLKYRLEDTLKKGCNTNLKVIIPEAGFKVQGVFDVSQHGDTYDYGTRGSIDKFAKCGSRYPMIVGHSHRTGISGTVWSVGACVDRQGYEGSVHSGNVGSILISAGLCREFIYS